MTAFSEALTAAFRDRNYATAYVARRCRVTERVVESWLAGGDTPSERDWDYLVRMCSDLHPLHPLWELDGRVRSCGALNAPPPPPPPAPEVGVDAPDPLEVGDGSLDLVLDLVEPPHRPIEAAPARESAPPVVFTCRITRGRLVKLEMPADLTLADVERIAAFLRTQADDFDPGGPA